MYVFVFPRLSVRVPFIHFISQYLIYLPVLNCIYDERTLLLSTSPALKKGTFLLGTSTNSPLEKFLALVGETSFTPNVPNPVNLTNSPDSSSVVIKSSSELITARVWTNESPVLFDTSFTMSSLFLKRSSPPHRVRNPHIF